MTDLTAIEQLTIDETTFIVADLPDEIQALVKKYEDWRDRLVVSQDEVVLVQSALQTLGQSVVQQIQQFEAAKEEAKVAAEAEAEAAVGEVVDSVAAEVAPAKEELLVIEDDATE